jgi:hypothetical protein
MTMHDRVDADRQLTFPFVLGGGLRSWRAIGPTTPWVVGVAQSRRRQHSQRWPDEQASGPVRNASSTLVAAQFRTSSEGQPDERARWLAQALGKQARRPSNLHLPGAAIARVPYTSAEAKAGLAAIRRRGGGDQRRRVRGSPKQRSTLESVKLVTAEIRSPSMVRTSRPTACAIGACSSSR